MVCRNALCLRTNKTLLNAIKPMEPTFNEKRRKKKKNSTAFLQNRVGRQIHFPSECADLMMAFVS